MSQIHCYKLNNLLWNNCMKTFFRIGEKMIILTVCQFLLVCLTVVDGQCVGKCELVIQTNLHNKDTKGLLDPSVHTNGMMDVWSLIFFLATFGIKTIVSNREMFVLLWCQLREVRLQLIGSTFPVLWMIYYFPFVISLNTVKHCFRSQTTSQK